jgi:predicted glycoside hydrolase/deacetylase ChbG (UPF0249 family)
MVRPNLVICADDLGMCADVDAGIFAASEAGTVAQASWMAPGPSATPAAAEAQRRGLACGIHLTFAAEWDRVRWSSLTGHPALAGADGNLPLHPSELRGVDSRILHAEGLAQIAAGVRQLGAPTHIDCHIAPVLEDLVVGLADASGLPNRDPLPRWPALALPIMRVLSLTDLPRGEKMERLLAFAASAGDDLSVVICHPAVDGPNLRALCSDALPSRKPWSREWRLTDLDVLTSRPVRDALCGRIGSFSDWAPAGQGVATTT